MRVKVRAMTALLSRSKSFSRVLALGAAIALVSVGSVACSSGGGEDAATAANVKGGVMPDGAAWKGVYYSQVYGYLHIMEEGSNAVGRWRTAAGDKWGELTGTIEGDVLRYEWTEHTIGMVGPNATSSGRGYFKYSRPSGEFTNDEIKGEWGSGEDEVGGTWSAVKQKNQDPDFKSVMPDETENKIQGGDWD